MAFDHDQEELSERMRSIELSSSAFSTTRRERRASDADSSSISVSRSTLIPIRLDAAKRWLPTPESQALTTGTPATAREDKESSASQPLQQHECSVAVCSVAKVSETTELLEIILGFLDTTNVLNLRRTRKKWNDITRESPHLRLHYYVHPQWNRHPSDFQLLSLKLSGLSIEAGEPVDMGLWIHVSMTLAAARSICPDARPGRRVRSRSIFEGIRGGLGSRANKPSDTWPAVKPRAASTNILPLEDLHIMQPPVLGMQAFVVEPSAFESPVPVDEDESPSACAKLHCDAGITLGFLASTALSLLAAPTESPETDGRKVLFKAIVSFASLKQGPQRRGTARSVTRIG